MKVALTGHRSQDLFGFDTNHSDYDTLKFTLKQKLIDLQPEMVFSGMALGADQIGAQLCCELQIPWIAAIPCDQQERWWPSHAQEIYQQLLSQAFEVKIISPGPYAPWKMQIRNQYMVDQANLLLAIFKTGTSKGGTYNCIKYAEGKIPIEIIDPLTISNVLNEKRK